MANRRATEAMEWVAKAITDGFSAEESVRVDRDGTIVMWLNDTGVGGHYTRLRFALTAIDTVTFEEFQREYLGGEPGQSVGEMYIERMRELARNQSDLDRFYIFLEDEKIYEWDQMGEPPYEMIRALYVEWLEEMTQERRKELYRINYNWNSANQNHMLYDVLDEEGNILPPEDELSR